MTTENNSSSEDLDEHGFDEAQRSIWDQEVELKNLVRCHHESLEGIEMLKILEEFASSANTQALVKDMARRKVSLEKAELQGSFQYHEVNTQITEMWPLVVLRNPSGAVARIEIRASKAPAATVAPAVTTGGTVPVVEAKEQRQDRRLAACEASGLVMPKSSSGRLPDGVGNVADDEGVTRQALSTDVKDALRRREALTKPGRVVHQN